MNPTTWRPITTATLVAVLGLSLVTPGVVAPGVEALEAGRVLALEDALWQDASGSQHTGLSGHGVIVFQDEAVDRVHPDLRACIDPHHNAQASVNGDPINAPVAPSKGHGTVVAGVLCGDGTMSQEYGWGERIRGTAPGVTLYTYKQLSWGQLPQWFAEDDIQVFTNSVTGDPIKRAAEHGATPDQDILFLQAAGNSGAADDPNESTTVLPDVSDARFMRVAAGWVDRSQVKASSSRGALDDPSTWPAITAPGCVYTTASYHPLMHVFGVYDFQDSPECAQGPWPFLEVAAVNHALGYTRVQGTSEATPYVAGIAAMMFETSPNLNATQARTLLEQTADPFLLTNDTDGDGTISPNEFHEQHGYKAGYGYVNATAAVAAAHYLGLHPDADVWEALGCAETGQAASGQLVLNPSGERCATATIQARETYGATPALTLSSGSLALVLSTVAWVLLLRRRLGSSPG